MRVHKDPDNKPWGMQSRKSSLKRNEGPYPVVPPRQILKKYYLLASLSSNGSNSLSPNIHDNVKQCFGPLTFLPIRIRTLMKHQSSFLVRASVSSVSDPEGETYTARLDLRNPSPDKTLPTKGGGGWDKLAGQRG
jgi:hypothetical protein